GGERPLEIRADNYVLFDGIHELPTFIWVNTASGRQFKIRIISLDHSNNKNDKIEEIVERYRLAIKTQKISPASIQASTIKKPPFLY
ncbi:MAG: hypothetical protein WCG27_03855, partial [Pseudomonadota bacterium]